MSFDYPQQNEPMKDKLQFVGKVITFLVSGQGIQAFKQLFSQGFYFAFMILYLVSPIDLIPELLFGPIGYIDDFLICAQVLKEFSKIMMESQRKKD